MVIKALPHIRLQEANAGKLAALDALWEEYQKLCQGYARYFCREAEPDGFAAYVFASPLSARWQRVAMMQAAGIAQSWRTNRGRAWREYTQRLERYEALPCEAQSQRKRPEWSEPHLPELRQVCIQANVNVLERLVEEDVPIALAAAVQGPFDFWLQVATLQKRKPLYLPVALSDYHRKALAGQTPNSSMSLHRRKGQWWLTLSVTQPDPEPVIPEAVAGADVGIANFLTDDTGHHYGSFKTDLAAAHQRDRQKRQRKAKLRACLEHKGVARLPSTSSVSGQRLSRRVRQDINRAVNLFLDDHVGYAIGVENLSVSTMRFQARRMNAYLYASNLAHIPEHLAWRAAQRGIPLLYVNPAYSSQACPNCHFADRANRPNQQTFCCQGCGYAAHADVVGARNLAQRVNDIDLAACSSVEAVKALLERRHQLWRHQNGYA